MTSSAHHTIIRARLMVYLYPSSKQQAARSKQHRTERRTREKKKMRNFAVLMIWVSLVSMRGSLGQQCGGSVVCSGGLCCSQWGWCGSTAAHCCEGCQSQCNCPSPTPVPPTPPRPPSPPPRTDLASLISEELFDQLLPYRNDPRCPAARFYTYQSFITAAAYFPDFAGVGNIETRKREIAAFLGQTSHETTGKLPEDIYASGYCFKEEIGCPDTYCVPDVQNPCVAGKKYCGRGPIQISYNYNYGPAGRAIGYDLLTDPDAVATYPDISFETAFWFWMTPQAPKPSCHDVIVGKWTPSPEDIAANRLPGYGVITNIINGGLECGHGEDDRVKDRIGFYQRYCGIFEVSTGDNIDCYNQRPFGN